MPSENSILTPEMAERIAKEPDIPTFTDDELDAVDLPASYIAETKALTALENMQALYRLRLAIAGNAAVHNDDAVKRLTLDEFSARATLGKIKRDCPQALVIAKEIAAVMAKNTEKARREVLGI